VAQRINPPSVGQQLYLHKPDNHRAKWHFSALSDNKICAIHLSLSEFALT